MTHRQHPLHQVETQTSHPGHARQLAPDQSFLGRAVHLSDQKIRSHAIGGKR